MKTGRPKEENAKRKTLTIRLTEELYKKADILSEIGVYCDEFDLTFYLNYCPYVDKEEFEDVAYDQQI